MPKNFKTKFSKTVITVTILINLLFLTLLFNQFFNLKNIAGLNTVSESNLFIVPILFLVMIVPVLLFPYNYKLENQQLKIEKFICKIFIDIKEIKECRVINADETGFSVKVFGSGGFWGYFGKYYSNSFGLVNMQTTTKKDLVLIKTNANKVYIISPNSPVEFVEIVKNIK